MKDKRSSGVLLHPTSLPGPGIGDLGEGAYRFVDWLAAAGQCYWQILPLVPVDAGGSPYSGLSALAGNPLLISPELLRRAGLLDDAEAEPTIASDSGEVDFAAVIASKNRVLRLVHARFSANSGSSLRASFDAFRVSNRRWLADYALFRALREHHGEVSWLEWPEEIRVRDAEALRSSRHFLAQDIERFEFQQFIFQRQWNGLRSYAREKGVRIIGDLPIFVAHDSADVWANPGSFLLDADGSPTVVAGVPPDYFSETGQRWGNPLYRWDLLRDRGYDWWIDRFDRILALVDVVRVDHFRGFAAAWQIPAHADTAVQGRWVPGPGADLFRRLRHELGRLPIIAEDLGVITPDVEALRDDLGFPGMRVLQFAFDGNPANIHLPANYPEGAFAYTGTHDNDTVVGWWRSAGELEKTWVRQWLGKDAPDAWDFIDAVFRSRAAVSIVPLQDILGLESEARMNTPGRATENWTWRIGEQRLDGSTASRLRELTHRTGRSAQH